jgi:putative flippase GtrA
MGEAPMTRQSGRWRVFVGGDQPLAQAARYAVVGAATAALDFGTYNAVLVALGTHGVVLLANAGGFFVATVVGYAANRRFTFRDRGVGSRFPAYLAVSVCGFLIESAVLLLLDRILGQAGVGGILVKNLERVAAAVPALVWSFTLYRSVVFAPGDGGPPMAALPLLPRVNARSAPWILAIVCAAALALRLPFLLALPLSASEWQAAHLADQALHAPGGLFGLVRHADTAWNALLEGLFRLTGPTVATPRFAGVACGALAVAATYLLGSAIASRRAALLAAALLAANGPSILVSHDGSGAALAPTLIAAAAWCLVRGGRRGGHAGWLALSAALMLVLLNGSVWSVALIPGWAVVLAGFGPRRAPSGVAVRPAGVAIGALLLAAWAAALFSPLGAFVGVAHAPPLSDLLRRYTYFWAAMVRSAGDLALLPAALAAPVGAAVMLGLAGSVAYGMSYRKGGMVALPVLVAALVGPLVALPPSLAAPGGGGAALLPLLAVLTAAAARWAARRLRTRAMGVVYPVAAALTAAVVGFGPLLGLGAYDGHLYAAALHGPPAPVVLASVRRAGMARGTPILLDSRGYRADVVGWVLALHGYRVEFVGNPYGDPLGRYFPGPRWAAVFADPPGPMGYVITRRDYLSLRQAGVNIPLSAQAEMPGERDYMVGWIQPVPGPATPRVGRPVPLPLPAQGTPVDLTPVA